CQPPPAVRPGTSMRPLLRRPQVQPLHRVWSQPCPRLAQGATGDRPAAVCSRQYDIELTRDRGDRQVATRCWPGRPPTGSPWITAPPCVAPSLTGAYGCCTVTPQQPICCPRRDRATRVGSAAPSSRTIVRRTLP